MPLEFTLKFWCNNYGILATFSSGISKDFWWNYSLIAMKLHQNTSGIPARQIIWGGGGGGNIGGIQLEFQS